MKNVIRTSLGALTFAAMAALLAVPAAQAGGWNGGYAYPAQRQSGGWCEGSGYGARPTSHPAHRFFDGRLYCAGQDAGGYWVGDARCEDGYGRKLVNDPAFVSGALGQGWGQSGGYDRGGRYDRGVSYRDNGRRRVWNRERGEFYGEFQGGRRWNDGRGDACRDR